MKTHSEEEIRTGKIDLRAVNPRLKTGAMFISDELFGFEGHHQSIKTIVGSFK